MTLGSVHEQLTLMIDAARVDGSARVVASCGDSAIELTFSDDGISADAGRVPSRHDEIVLEILGWRRDEDRHTFVRRWHTATPSHDVADDVLRAAVNGYLCESVELKLLLAGAATLSSASR
jgi:hypothetical protein